MQYSKHNIVAPVTDSDQWYIVNVLSGNADLIDSSVGENAQAGILPKGEDLAAWTEKGYVVDPAEELSRYRLAYLDFLDTRDADEVQVFFVPWYSCNFSCSYCFQEGYGWKPEALNPEVTDSFFTWMRTNLANRRKYVTLFGGEPLLPGAQGRKFVIDMFARCRQDHLDVAIVTNGYTLSSYLDVLENQPIREIQVTLDGPRAMHDQRRMLKGGGPSFDKIVEGIDGALALGITINLRMVVDRENLATLPELAQFAIDRGWTTNPHFKTQIGRNYELHTCQVGNERLYSRIDMYQMLYALVKEHPHILEFHRPAFSLARFLFENDQLPAPLFDACTGTKTEWALDGTGRVYSCTATVGKQGEELGTYYPVPSENANLIAEWQSRDVCSIEECKTCNMQLACGGGCTAVAKNRTGNILSTDCRPISDLLSMGLATYS